MPPYDVDNDEEFCEWLLDNIYVNYDQTIAHNGHITKEELYDWYLEEKEELHDWYLKDKEEMAQLTNKQRIQFKRERQELVGSLITQQGDLCGAIVKEHVRGSQYVLRLANGTEVSASHKKGVKRHAGLSESGWRLWEDR
jgi:hypothetical protein|tara:strand:- start:1284 stop:1703 length:420 start_codon:yes stop_codon:yes gene_type:complete